MTVNIRSRSKAPASAPAMQPASAGAHKRRNKFGNVRTELDGHTFASKAEAKYYATLKLREKAGEVTDIELQPVYVLQVKPRITFRPDFRFTDRVAGRVRVVDVKGHETQVFRLKKRLLKAVHGIEVEVVK